jgi:NADPH:quinone reductase-like Zn-dependent oxidoreductase
MLQKRSGLGPSFAAAKGGLVTEQPMKALQYAEYGAPEVLRVVDVEEPHAGPGQIRVAVKAVGINPVDWKGRSGRFKAPLPAITGSDVSGVVDEIGDGVTDVSIGDEVFGMAVSGGAAQYAVLRNFAMKPAGMSFEEAAGLPVPVETAVRVLELLDVGSGQTLLVNAAAGGVGSAAVQFARARGLTVIGTASPSNHDYLRSLGATPTTYGIGLPARVKDLAPNGVDAVFDAAGRGALPDLIEITGDAAKVITIADPQAEQYGVRYASGRGSGDRAWHALPEAAELWEQGKFTMPIAQTFPLADGAQAHALSEEGHVRGKLVLLVD